MAPTKKSNESLMFLYVCVLKMKDSSVDFSEVAAATNLKVPAARMRWARLKKQLEAELVNGKFDLAKGSAEASEPTEAAATPDPAMASSASAASAAPAKKKRGVKRKKTATDDEAEAEA